MGNNMDHDTATRAAHNMQSHGGGFASALAEAFFRADSHNRARILGAFGDLFDQFARIGRVQLIAKGGRLYYPTGQGEDKTKPSMLYVQGEDVTICPWPWTINRTNTPVSTLRATLASALFDERETNETWSHGATILLPDGTEFDFDRVLWEAENSAAADVANEQDRERRLHACDR